MHTHTVHTQRCVRLAYTLKGILLFQSFCFFRLYCLYCFKSKNCFHRIWLIKCNPVFGGAFHSVLQLSVREVCGMGSLCRQICKHPIDQMRCVYSSVVYHTHLEGCRLSSWRTEYHFRTKRFTKETIHQSPSFIIRCQMPLGNRSHNAKVMLKKRRCGWLPEIASPRSRSLHTPGV